MLARYWAPHGARLSAIGGFLRTPSLARSVMVLLAGVIALLLLANFSTLVLIQRTADFNEQVESNQAIRRAARSLLFNVQMAEAAQRGFLLTGQPAFLTDYQAAKAAAPELIAVLERRVAAGPTDASGAPEVVRLKDEKFAEMSESLDLATRGRIGEAVRLVRTGQGKALMDQLRVQIHAIDADHASRVETLTRQSERSAVFTVIINAIAALLIVILAGVMIMLVRRYLAEINAARSALDEVNAGLEETVRGRTAALTRANEEVQRFAYIVSHDLRSPLVNVMGFTAELEQAAKTMDHQIARLEADRPDLVEANAVTAVREDIPEAVGFIRASTQKMDRLINAILKLSRDGRRGLVAEPLDMTAMVQGIADTVRHQAEAAEAEVVVEPLASIESDRLAIEQIMGNLIDNAIKYLEPGRAGRIVVSSRDLPGDWVEYAVADNGRGVSERDRERVFELFRRSGRQDRPGEGLGLAFVRNSVRRLGGTIEIESTLGTGSTFRLKFPKRLVVVEAGDLL